MKLLFLTRYGYQGASSRYRFYQYFPYFKKSGYSVEVSPLFGDEYLRLLYAGRNSLSQELLIFFQYLNAFIRRLATLPSFGQYDGIIIEKELLPYLPGGLEQWFLKMGRRISLDYDDPVYLTYEGIRNPILRLLFADKIKRIIKASAFVTVGNTYLESYARSCTDGVYIIPPAIDLGRYDLISSPSRSGELRIGWIGTPFTLKYVTNFSAMLQRLARSYNFRLVLIGVDNYALENVCVEVKKWDYDAEVADLKSLDIGIMPLTDESWSRGKCGIKLLQYMAAGIPAVASPVGINAEIIRDGENGFLAANEQEWMEKLSRLVADPDLRARLGREGRRTVEEYYSLEGVAHRLSQIYEREFRQ